MFKLLFKIQKIVKFSSKSLFNVGMVLLAQGLLFATQGRAQVAFHPKSVVGWINAQTKGLVGLAPYDIILDVLNEPSDLDIIPKGFRSPLNFPPEKADHVNIRGFHKLRMSGAAQFTRNRGISLLRHLQQTFKVKPSDVYIVDLREEPHGHINNHAVTWYYGPLTVQKFKTPDAIKHNEVIRVQQVNAFPLVYINQVIKTTDGMPFNKVPMILPRESACDEGELVRSLGANYVRIPATDHFRPEDRSVDEFIKFVESLSPEAWLHFKCRGGRGRTTTFMALYDMMRNPDIPFEEYIKRQVLLGGVDLGRLPSEKQVWKRRLSFDKLNFIRTFHQYLHASDGYGKMSWTNWAAKHNYQSRTGEYHLGVD